MTKKTYSLMKLLLILLLAFTFTSCRSKNRKPSSGDIVYSVSLEKVSEEEIPDALELKGAFFPYEKIEIKSESVGKVLSVAVSEGQSINAGELLAQIDPEQLKLKLAELKLEQKEVEAKKEAQMSLSNKTPVIPTENNNHENVNPVDANDHGLNKVTKDLENSTLNTNPVGNSPPPPAISEDEKKKEENIVASEIDPHKVELDQRAYDASLDRIKAEISLTEKRIELAKITAPIKGIVTKKNIGEGSSVNEGDMLFQIVQMDPAVLSVYASAESVSDLQRDQNVDVYLENSLSELLKGSIFYIALEADAQNKNYEVKIAVPNNLQKIKSGMNGKMFLALNKKRKALMINNEALIQQDKKNYVYVLQSSTLVEKKEIELGLINASQVEVKKGLSAKDKVVIKGKEQLSANEEFIKAEEK